MGDWCHMLSALAMLRTEQVGDAHVMVPQGIAPQRKWPAHGVAKRPSRCSG